MEIVWDAKAILGGETTEAIVDRVKKDVASFKSSWQQMKDPSPAELFEFIKQYEDIGVQLGNVGIYLELKFTEDSTDQHILAEISKLKQLDAELDEDLLPFSLWFKELPEDKAQTYITAQELGRYKHYLETVREFAPHTRSEEVEKILSLHSITGRGAFSSLYTIITSGYMYDFQGKSITEEELRSFVKDKDPNTREEAYKLLLGKYVDESTVLFELYKNIVLEWKNSCKIRNYKNPIAIRNLGNEVTEEAVNALLNVVQKNRTVFQEYFKLKHDMNENAYPFTRFHLYAPYKNDVHKEYSYEESKELVLDTYKKFSEEFYTAAKEIFDKNMVHAFPKKNKRGGAYCMCTNPGMPPYVMLNHTNKLKDLFTMMHEFGHGIHDQLARVQTPMYYHATLPMAETASIFGEMLLSSRLLSESEDDNVKKAILMDLLDGEYASIGRQSYFVIFEKEAHEMIANGATKGDLEKRWMELLREQFGDMEVPEEFKNEWNYIPHIHHTPFYCYAYAWGNLLVLALFAMYKEEGDAFVPKMKALLAAGSSDYPLALLTNIGIDATSEDFWQKGFDIIKEQVEELKKLA